MDTEGLLRSLNEHSVRYVAIGATAFPVHGYARATLDIDIFIEPTPENAGRARAALIAFGYDLADVSVEDLAFQETADRENFQGRYVLRHPWTGSASCSAADAYRKELAARREREAQSLASLTGWDISEIRRKTGAPAQITGAGPVR